MTRPPAPSLAERIATGLAKIGTALRHEAWVKGGARGLTPTQGQILATLHAEPGLGPSALATRLGVSLPTVSEAVRTLVEKGLVRREADSADRRALRLVLTARGAREGARSAAWPDFLSGAVEALSPDEQAVFFTGLVKMIRMLQERGQIAAARMCVSCRYFRPYAHADSQQPHHCQLIDAPLGPEHLRLDCAEHEEAEPPARDEAWDRFISGHGPAR